MVILDLIKIISGIRSMLRAMIFHDVFHYSKSPSFPFERLLQIILPIFASRNFLQYELLYRLLGICVILFCWISGEENLGSLLE